MQTVNDGFEFGKETLTILAAGRYGSTCGPWVAPAGPAWTFSMSRSTVPLQLARLATR